MQIRPTEHASSAVYYAMIGSIMPRPIAWIATRDEAGRRNLAPFSFFTGIVARPATLCFSAGRAPDGGLKDTTRNILATEQFIVNVVPAALGEAMVHTSGGWASDVDEFENAGLRAIPGEVVAADRVHGSPIQFECRTHQIVPVEDDDGGTAAHLIIGRIELIHVADAVLDAQGRIDPMQVDALGRMGGGAYCTTRDLMQIARPKIPKS